jgi:predicted metal-binding membrane protein
MRWSTRLTVAIVLFVIWLLAVLLFHVTSFLIHLILLIAIVVVIYDLITAGRRGTRTPV